MVNNPFVVGIPVPPAKFINRAPLLQTLFSRVKNGESSALVGEPQIGKTSLLRKMQDPSTISAFLGSRKSEFVFCFVDLYATEPDYTPATFWDEVLQRLEKQLPPETILRGPIEQARQANFRRQELLRVFEAVGQNNVCLVLLLDEFDCLLEHPNFQSHQFFAMLRTIATHSGGLALVTSTRWSIARMNQWGRRLLAAGSPLFNYLTQEDVGPFEERYVAELLDWAGDRFDTPTRLFIRRIAGRHPYLLQAAGAAMFEMPEEGSSRLNTAVTRYYKRVASNFDELWANLDDNARTAAVILSLMELGGQVAGDSFSYREIERVQKFGPELARLEELGLAERAGRPGWQFDTEHLMLWQGERWTMAAQAFTWWVRDVVIDGQRHVPTFDDWLAGHCYRGLLTQEQWDKLVGAVQKLPGWATRGVGVLAKLLAQELLKRLLPA